MRASIRREPAILATERLLEIEALFANQVARIVVLELDAETLQLVLYFNDVAIFGLLNMNYLFRMDTT